MPLITIEAQHTTVGAKVVLPHCRCEAQRLSYTLFEGCVAMSVNHVCNHRDQRQQAFIQYVSPDYPVLCDPLVDALEQSFQ